MDETRAQLLQCLDEQVDRLLDFYRHLPDPNLMVYELWSAKDILAHLTFWHESFARNTADLANGREPHPLDGKYNRLNLAGVEQMRPLALEDIIARFEAAHHVLAANILSENLSLIPYRKGAPNYTPEKHLEIVTGHIERHLHDVMKAVRHRPMPSH